MQVDRDVHITLQPDYLQYMNHSCAPTVFWNTSEMCVEALQDIAVGAELTFFYPSTEWSMSSVFECDCGSACCLGTIAGASQLAASLLHPYKLSRHIRTMLAATSQVSLSAESDGGAQE